MSRKLDDYTYKLMFCVRNVRILATVPLAFRRAYVHMLMIETVGELTDPHEYLRGV